VIETPEICRTTYAKNGKWFLFFRKCRGRRKVRF
jgi:hypothetical protein